MNKTFLSIPSAAALFNAAVLSLFCASYAHGQQSGGEASQWALMPPALESGTPSLTYAAPVGVDASKKLEWVDPSRRYTFEQLGARYPFNLRGIDGSDSVSFNVRADNVVTRAEVDLTYSYSPALMSDLSHINVLVNDEVAFSIPVPRDEAGKSLQRTVSLPAHLITEFNRLRFQLIGHYTLECEDPLHSSLWANISNQSTLSLDVQHIPLANDLSLLPLPFFDRRDGQRLTLPVVFANDKSEITLESAGMVASWFGALAGSRGAEFPAHLDGSYPEKGNAVVLMRSDAETSLPVVSGPTIAVTDNPNDSNGKLLWVMGRNAEEIKQAAQALVTSAATLTGQAATIERIEQLEPRKPYDAPNWLPTDRPVAFGEIVPEAMLRATGYQGQPIRLNLRLPPDLFGWREKPVPVDLRYRYTVQPGRTNSSLLAYADQQFLRSFPLPSVDQMTDPSWEKNVSENEMLPVRVLMEVPLDDLLQQDGVDFHFSFMYDYIKEGACRDIIIDNVRGRIDPDSTLDFSGYPHFMPLPDLATFGASGFPFTRLADLSQTSVVLADSPAPEDVTTYLALMSRFGESTGYPATHVTVGLGQAGLSVKDKDVVVIASGDQSWLNQWAEYMPATLAGENKRFGTSDQVFKHIDWKTPDPRNSQSLVRTRLNYESVGDVAVFAGFESPETPGRSVVLISSNTPKAQEFATRALIDSAHTGHHLLGSVAVAHEGGVVSLANEYSYTTGSLGFWRNIEWNVAKYWPKLLSLWWLGWLLMAIVVIVLARVLRRLVRGQSKQ